jgi:hypothetical protein
MQIGIGNEILTFASDELATATIPFNEIPIIDLAAK